MSILARHYSVSAPVAEHPKGSLAVPLLAGSMGGVVGYLLSEGQSGRGLNAAIGFIATAGLAAALLAPPKPKDVT